jgi:hypothetical protein
MAEVGSAIPHALLLIHSSFISSQAHALNSTTTHTYPYTRAHWHTLCPREFHTHHHQAALSAAAGGTGGAAPLRLTLGIGGAAGVIREPLALLRAPAELWLLPGAGGNGDGDGHVGGGGGGAALADAAMAVLEGALAAGAAAAREAARRYK